MLTRILILNQHIDGTFSGQPAIGRRQFEAVDPRLGQPDIRLELPGLRELRVRRTRHLSPGHRIHPDLRSSRERRVASQPGKSFPRGNEHAVRSHLRSRRGMHGDLQSTRLIISSLKGQFVGARFAERCRARPRAGIAECHRPGPATAGPPQWNALWNGGGQRALVGQPNCPTCAGRERPLVQGKHLILGQCPIIEQNIVQAAPERVGPTGVSCPYHKGTSTIRRVKRREHVGVRD